MTQVADEFTTGDDTKGPTSIQRPDRIRVVNTAGVPGPDPRDEIPPLGFTEYWYPAIGTNKVPRRKPVMVKMLGQEVVLFRGKTGIAALTNHCTHRGAPLDQGKCMYEGTLSCPYHGWTYDENGHVVAVLSEGPDSVIAGRAVGAHLPGSGVEGHRVLVDGGGSSQRSREGSPAGAVPRGLARDVGHHRLGGQLAAVSRELQRQPRVLRASELTGVVDDPVDQDFVQGCPANHHQRRAAPHHVRRSDPVTASLPRAVPGVGWYVAEA